MDPQKMEPLYTNVIQFSDSIGYEKIS